MGSPAVVFSNLATPFPVMGGAAFTAPKIGGGTNTPVPFAEVIQGGVVGSAYSESVSASGGTGPYTYTLLSGSLPANLSLSSSGVISGTPTATGTATFSVQATDSTGATGHTTFQITIASAAATGGGNYGFTG